MDRHDFVEKLLAEKKELEEKRSSLIKEKDVAHSRSYDRFRSMFRPPEDEKMIYADGEVKFTINNGDWRIINPSNPEHRVSTEEIKSLCAEVKALEKECDKLEEEIKQLRKQDFIAEILKLADLK